MRSTKSYLPLFALLSAFTFLHAPARADLIGDSITATGVPMSTTSAVIGPGVEFTQLYENGTSKDFTWDFGADTLTVRNVHFGINIMGSDNLTFGGFDSVITNVSVSSNDYFFASILSPSFTANSITMDLSNTVAYGGATLVFKIETQSSSVPDGGLTGVMLGAALAGFGIVRRRFAT